ncbi:MAG: hypothetical protein LWW89_15725 [Oryzomicrobium sp.]|nr:hypothetical protein [Oryzomicrobium sp.]
MQVAFQGLDQALLALATAGVGLGVAVGLLQQRGQSLGKGLEGFIVPAQGGQGHGAEAADLGGAQGLVAEHAPGPVEHGGGHALGLLGLAGAQQGQHPVQVAAAGPGEQVRVGGDAGPHRLERRQGRAVAPLGHQGAAQGAARLRQGQGVGGGAGLFKGCQGRLGQLRRFGGAPFLGQDQGQDT